MTRPRIVNWLIIFTISCLSFIQFSQTYCCLFFLSLSPNSTLAGILLVVMQNNQCSLTAGQEHGRTPLVYTSSCTYVLSKTLEALNRKQTPLEYFLGKVSVVTQPKALDSTLVHRFQDSSPSVRAECVKYSRYFLVYHPNLVEDTTGMQCMTTDSVPSAILSLSL